jgi:hypothetical protein
MRSWVPPQQWCVCVKGQLAIPNKPNQTNSVKTLPPTWEGLRPEISKTLPRINQALWHMPGVPAILEAEIGGSRSNVSPREELQDSIGKRTKAKRARGTAQVAEPLPSNDNILSSNTSTAKEKGRGSLWPRTGFSGPEPLASKDEALTSISSTIKKENKRGFYSKQCLTIIACQVAAVFWLFIFSLSLSLSLSHMLEINRNQDSQTGFSSFKSACGQNCKNLIVQWKRMISITQHKKINTKVNIKINIKINIEINIKNQ